MVRIVPLSSSGAEYFAPLELQHRATIKTNNINAPLGLAFDGAIEFNP